MCACCYGTRSFRYKVVSIQVVSIQVKVDSLHLKSRFDTRYLFRYRILLLYYNYINDLNEPSKTYSLEGTQTSFVNETNPYLREPSRAPQ